MISAFGVEHGSEFAKRDNRKSGKDASGAAIAAGGGTVATVGLAGGGIPGVRAKGIMADVKSASGRRAKVAGAARAYRGGEFGYRHNAHHTFKTFGLGSEAPKNANRAQSFSHGDMLGRGAAEDKIIRHLKVGRRVSNVALVGGAAAATYGANRARGQKVAKAEKGTQRLHGALLGAGGTVAATSIGGEKILRRQGGKWASQEASSLKAAQKIIPNMKPNLSNNAATKNPKVLAGKSKAQAEAAGRLRGEAVQARYFSRVYGEMGNYARKVRNPALATAAVGAGGLLLARKKIEKAQDRAHQALQEVVKAQGNAGYVSKSLPAIVVRNAKDIIVPASVGSAGIGAATVSGHRKKEGQGKPGSHDDAKRAGAYGVAAGASSAAGHAAYRMAGLRVRAKGVAAERTLPEGMSRSQRTKIERDHRKSFGLAQGDKAGAKKKPGYFRTYPKELPGWKYKRALGAISGRREHVIGAAASALPVAAVVAHSRRKNQSLSKSAFGIVTDVSSRKRDR